MRRDRLQSLVRRAVLTMAATMLASSGAAAQRAPRPAKVFSHADTPRGTNGPARSWCDAQFYDLHVSVSPRDSSIRGWNAITYRVLETPREMQIDLQVPMQ